MFIKIKPLSVNQAWQGRRYKSKLYEAYERELLLLLPRVVYDTAGKLAITMRVGYSNKLSDIDNFIKPTLDILQKKYGINDNKIYKLAVEKIDTKKGEEFIDFEITESIELN